MVTDLHQMVAPGAEAEVAAGSELGGGNKLTQLKDKFVDLVKEVPGTMKREMEKLCDSLMPVFRIYLPPDITSRGSQRAPNNTDQDNIVGCTCGL